MTIKRLFHFIWNAYRLGKPKYKITSLNNLHPPDYIFSYSGTLCLGIQVFCIIIPKIISQNFVKMYPNVKLYSLGTTPTFFSFYFFKQNGIQPKLLIRYLSYWNKWSISFLNFDLDHQHFSFIHIKYIHVEYYGPLVLAFYFHMNHLAAPPQQTNLEQPNLKMKW